MAAEPLDIPSLEERTLACQLVGDFAPWLEGTGQTLAFTTYQANMVIMLGWDGPRLTLLARHFDKPMGFAVDGQRMVLATRHDLILFANAPLLAYDFLHDQPGRYDALYLPRLSYHTGDQNIHDVAFGKDGLWMVNTRFGCLARPSANYCFEPAWSPPFLTELAPEDRCHLNGVAMVDGEPRFVTALGETDTVGGWRPNKATGGVVLEVPSGRVVLRGLAMPHSPRWHLGHLYVLNSGAGELLRVDVATGRADVVCVLPAYLRGLCLHGDFALVGMCKVRERHLFGGLPVQERFQRLHCGVAVIDLRNGRNVGVLEVSSGCTELFEVALLAGMRRPMIVGPEKEEARQAFPAPAFSYWLRPQNELPSPPT